MTKRYGFEFKSYISEPQMLSINNHYSKKHKELPESFSTADYGFMFDVSYINNIPSDPIILAPINNSQYLFFNNMRLITLGVYAGVLGRTSSGNYFLEGGINLGLGMQSQQYDLDGTDHSAFNTPLIAALFVTAGRATPLGGVIGFSVSLESIEPTVDGNEFSIATVDASIFYKIDF